ncbi:Rho GTPase activation protein [Chytridium lagenaria]|nr:Rho GTPase activation protein [Chytridium lagenaria]
MQQSPPSLAVEDATSRAGRGVSSGTSNLTASPRIDDKRGNASKRITTAFNWAKKKATSDLAIAAGMAGGAGSGVRSPDPARVVFGVPLDQSVAVSRVNDMYELPSVVYRCIEYLDAMHAFEEEGIYRLSGLSSIIQMLKDRFNNEGDVDLLGSGERYDVHAIAGLLKLYLRELQNLTPVLTKHLQKDFIRITEIQDRTDRITELSRLVSKLPLTNYTLLRIMIAHLVRVVQASDINKMTVRNVGIVFSPTLGIPVVVLTLMMAEYDHVFCWEDPQKSQLMRDREREMADRLGKERELSLRRQAQFEADVEKAEKERQQQQQQQPPTPQQHHHHTQQRINISPMAYSDSTESRREEKQAWEASGEGPSVVIMQPHYEDAEGMDERSRNIAAKKARREQARMSIAPGLLMARNQNKAGVEDRRTNRNSFIMIDDSNTLPPRDGSASLTDETGGVMRKDTCSTCTLQGPCHEEMAHLMKWNAPGQG